MLTDFEKNVLGATEVAPTPAPAPKKSLFNKATSFLGDATNAVGNFAIGVGKGAVDTVLSVPRNVEKVVKEGTKLSIEKQNNKIREQINAQNDELLKIFKSLPKDDPRREKYKRLIQQNLDQFNELNNSEKDTIAQVDRDSSWVPLDEQGKAKAVVDDAVAAKGKAQRAGFVTEKIGELIVPATATAKADKALKGWNAINSTSKGAKLFNAGARITARSGLDAATAAASTFGQGAYQGRLDTEEGRAGLVDDMKTNALFAGGAKALFSTGGELLRNTKLVSPKNAKLDYKTQNEMVNRINDTRKTYNVYEQAVKSGDMAADDIFQPGTKILTDQAKTNLADDIAMKMEKYVGGRLGKAKADAFRNAIKGMDATYDDIDDIAKEIIDNTDLAMAQKTAGEIVQGPKQLQEIARKNLPKLDTSKVRSFDDLTDVIKNKIAENSSTVDESLSKNPAKMPFDALAKTTKVGTKDVVSKPVNDALDHLEEFYTGSKDYVNAERIRQIKEAGSLTAKEVNDVAREYSREFSKKAFSKLGEPLTSVNARAMENTRSGLKGIARNLVGDDAVKAVDKETSELYSLLPYMERNSAKANELRQKLTDRGLMEKIGNATGKAIDWSTGGFARSFVTSFFPRGQGLKPTNFVELEKALSGNLDKLTKLSNLIENGADDAAIIAFAKKYLAEPAKSLYKNGTAGVAARRIIPEVVRESNRPDFENDN